MGVQNFGWLFTALNSTNQPTVGLESNSRTLALIDTSMYYSLNWLYDTVGSKEPLLYA